MERITINGIEYYLVPRVKSELDFLKEKYETGDYLVVFKQKKVDEWDFCYRPNDLTWKSDFDYKLIHKKHESVLNSYLADNSVDYDTNNPLDSGNFIDTYIEDYDYRLKPKQEYPIFKRHNSGNVYKINDKLTHTIMFHSDISLIGELIRTMGSWGNDFETIPHDKETGLYYLQPVWCWDNTDEYIKQIGFYTEKNKVIHPGNSFGALDWESIEPVTPEQLQTMPFMFEMYQKLLKKRKN